MFSSAANEALNTPLARRVDLPTLGQSFNVHSDRQGWSEIVYERPPVEEIEHAAMKLRAIMLGQDEEVYLNRVLDSLWLSLQDEARPVAAELKQLWKSFPEMHYFSANGSRFDVSDDANVPLLKDRQIAVDWLYGHLLHFDSQRRHRIRNVGDESKYISGLLWAKDAILLVASVRNCIVAADDEGKLR